MLQKEFRFGEEEERARGKRARIRKRVRGTRARNFICVRGAELIF